jgi:hypothetical protein
MRAFPRQGVGVVVHQGGFTMLKNSPARGRAAILVAIANLICISLASADQFAITADPPVPRPNTEPCVVKLFSDVKFSNFSPKLFDYAPPDDCPGPWARVVFEADFAVTTGRQFDRTANIWIGGANIYFGTTQEPSSTQSPHWHVERDLTDYAALLTMPQAGRTDLGNLFDTTYTGVIYGSADLQFYPLEPGETPPVTADLVLPLSASPNGGTIALQTSGSGFKRRFALPRNVERAYLDVVAQSQASDEFWMLCVPDDVAHVLQSCGGTGFRETEIAIDDQPAGVAPIYPWIFTGGIDPYLWRPIPGVQTFNFVPYRVDLTPFAGVLSNGQEHSVAVRVYNANHNFATTATLLIYLDHEATEVTGEVTQNTLSADPTPDIQEDVKTMDEVTTGTVIIRSSRRFEIEGFVRTSHGMVRTEVEQSIDFSSQQDFNITSTTFAQNLNQTTSISSQTTTRNRNMHRATSRQLEWPLTLSFSSVPRPGGITARTTIIRQEYDDHETLTQHDHGRPISSSRDLSSLVTPMDTLLVQGGVAIGREGQASSHQYFSQDSSGGCYSRRITAELGAVTEIVDGEGCPDR